MSRQARFGIEASPADVAEELAFLFVSFFMGVENGLTGEGFFARCAFVNGLRAGGAFILFGFAFS